MSLFKNKLFLTLVAVALLCIIFSYWLAKPEGMTRDQFMLWVQDSYSQQFCVAIYPHLSDCLNISRTECPDAAKKSLAPCLQDLKVANNITIEESKKLYASVKDCFQQQMHTDILAKYLIPDAECVQKMQ